MKKLMAGLFCLGLASLPFAAQASPPFPDLTIRDVSQSISNDQLSAKVLVQNRGAIASKRTVLRVDCWHSEQKKWVAISKTIVEPIPALGSTTTVKIATQWTPTELMKAVTRYVVDAGNDIKELDETNNTAHVPAKASKLSSQLLK